jgi:hypothetical protein
MSPKSVLDPQSLTCENGEMTAREPLILYSRVDCHLCDRLVEVLDRMAVPWRPVDIDDDAELVARYGIHVPVLRHPDSGQELFYPFSEAEVRRLLEYAD